MFETKYRGKVRNGIKLNKVKRQVNCQGKTFKTFIARKVLIVIKELQHINKKIAIFHKHVTKEEN